MPRGGQEPRGGREDEPRGGIGGEEPRGGRVRHSAWGEECVGGLQGVTPVRVPVVEAGVPWPPRACWPQ